MAMDRRERKYYLLNVDYFSYKMRMEFIKICCPSRKIHRVKEHWKEDPKSRRYWQMMISCRKEESESLEYEFRKGIRNDGYGTSFVEI
jgi:hypothetical protein